MTLSALQIQHLKQAIESGLPLEPRPYLALAERIGADEVSVLRTIETWIAEGLIKRLGIVVQHRRLGYVANAMVVWDIPDDRVDDLAARLAAEDCVTLCYRRPRRLPDWPYNLFTMIHGKSRDRVLAQLDRIVSRHGLTDMARHPLFSTRQFKQRGGHYSAPPTACGSHADCINTDAGTFSARS
jgi:DNA-binding Lrp family transcriptional regulator